MNWAEISIATTTEGIEIVNGFLMAHGVSSVMIEDANDFKSFLSDTTVHWDYVEESLMALSEAETKIKFYLPDTPQGFETLSQIRTDLPSLLADVDLGTLEINISYREEEEWETAWQKYYHPIEISDRLVIVPEWETYTPKEGQKALLLNPGMAFGTGSHQTTKLCLQLLDQAVRPGDRLLDMGCGSGILSIAARLLGADEVTGVDIDQLAVKIAGENAALNGIMDHRFTLYCGDVTEDQELANKLGEAPYDLITANIVADVIKGMKSYLYRFLRPQGTLIVSGIISERSDEVADALKQEGFIELVRTEDSEWTAIRFKKE